MEGDMGVTSGVTSGVLWGVIISDMGVTTGVKHYCNSITTYRAMDNNLQQ